PAVLLRAGQAAEVERELAPGRPAHRPTAAIEYGGPRLHASLRVPDLRVGRASRVPNGQHRERMTEESRVLLSHGNDEVADLVAPFDIRHPLVVGQVRPGEVRERMADRQLLR